MLHTEPWVRQAGAIVTGVAVGGTARLCRSFAVPAVTGSSGSSRLRGVAQRAGAARRGVVPLQEPGTLQPLPGLQVPRAPGLPAPPWSQLSSDTSSCAASPYVRQDAGVRGRRRGGLASPCGNPTSAQVEETLDTPHIPQCTSWLGPAEGARRSTLERGLFAGTPGHTDRAAPCPQLYWRAGSLPHPLSSRGKGEAHPSPKVTSQAVPDPAGAPGWAPSQAGSQP